MHVGYCYKEASLHRKHPVFSTGVSKLEPMGCTQPSLPAF
jgi:hypothetical protein